MFYLLVVALGEDNTWIKVFNERHLLAIEPTNDKTLKFIFSNEQIEFTFDSLDDAVSTLSVLHSNLINNETLQIHFEATGVKEASNVETLLVE